MAAKPWEENWSQPTPTPSQAPAAPKPWEENWQESPEPSNFQRAWESTVPGMTVKAGQWALENIAVPVGTWIDKYTGAPTRQGIGAIQEGKSLQEAASAAWSQVGENPEKAPTGKQIAQRAGVPDTSLSEVFPGIYSETGDGWKLQRGGPLDVTASGAAGLGVDVLADPTNVVPVGTLAKAGVKGAQGAGKVAAGAARAAGRVVEAVPGGSIVTSGSGALSNQGKKLGSTIKQIVDPKVLPTWAGDQAIARKHNIDPELLSLDLKYGEPSFIARHHKIMAQGPDGQKALEKHLEGYRQISVAVENRLKKMAGGELPDIVEAGDLIHTGMKRVEKQIMDSADITYRKASEYVDQTRKGGGPLLVNRKALATLQRQLKLMEGEVVRAGKVGSDKVAARKTLAAINDVKNGIGSYDQAVETLQSLGRNLESAPILGQIPPDAQRMSDLYGKLKKALTETVRVDINPDFAVQLDRNNEIMSSFFRDRDLLSNAFKVGPDGKPVKAGEQIFRQYVLNGNTKYIDVLKSRMSPEDFGKLKGAFMDKILRTNGDGLYSFSQARKAVDGKSELLGRMLDEAEQTDLGELIKLGEGHGVPATSDRIAATGASLRWRDIPGNVVNSSMMGFMEKRADQVAKRGESLTVPSVSLDTDNFGPGARSGFGKTLKASQSIAPSYYGQNQKQGEQKQSADERWAMNGFGKLIKEQGAGFLNDGPTIDRISNSPRARRLLTEAANYEPGSKAMRRVLEQLQEEFGGKSR